MKSQVALFFGGTSVEHDISIITAMQMYSLLKERYDVIPVYIDKKGLWYSGNPLTSLDNFKTDDIVNRKGVFRVNIDVHSKSLFRQKNTSCFKKYADFDVAFNATHGGGGENGDLSGLFEMLNICYTGSGVKQSAICMDKSLTKILLKDLKVKSVNGVSFLESEYALESDKILAKIKKNLGNSVIIKPCSLGSSIGIAKAENEAELKDAIANAFTFDNKVLVEECIQDFKEINIALLKDKDKIIVSRVEEISKNNDFLSFEDKYLNSGNSLKTMERETAKIENELLEKIENTAKKVYEKMELSGIVRMDFIAKENEIYLNEINTIPGSLAFYLFDERDIIFRMIENAKYLKNAREGKVKSFASNVLNTTSISKYAK